MLTKIQFKASHLLWNCAIINFLELLIQFHGLLNDTGLGNVADLLKTELESKGVSNIS